MSKINTAINEARRLAECAQKDTLINHIHPLSKLIITILYIAITVSFDKYNVSNLIIMAIYPIAFFIIGDFSFRVCIKRIKVVLALVCITGVFNPLFDKSTLFSVGAFQVTGGVVSMMTLMIKGIYTVLAGYILISTTSIEGICYSLRIVKFPKTLVTVILLVYRYIFLMLRESETIMTAYSMRAPNQRGIHFKVWGSLTGQLLLRSSDRAKDVYDSMSMRGFNGAFCFLRGKNELRLLDIIFVVLWSVVIVSVRFIPFRGLFR